MIITTISGERVPQVVVVNQYVLRGARAEVDRQCAAAKVRLAETCRSICFEATGERLEA